MLEERADVPIVRPLTITNHAGQSAACARRRAAGGTGRAEARRGRAAGSRPEGTGPAAHKGCPASRPGRRRFPSLCRRSPRQLSGTPRSRLPPRSGETRGQQAGPHRAEAHPRRAPSCPWGRGQDWSTQGLFIPELLTKRNCQGLRRFPGERGDSLPHRFGEAARPRALSPKYPQVPQQRPKRGARRGLGEEPRRRSQAWPLAQRLRGRGVTLPGGLGEEIWPVLDRGPPWGAHGEPCPGSPAWGPLPGIGRGRVHSRCVRALGELKQPPTPGRLAGNLKSRQLPAKRGASTAVEARIVRLFFSPINSEFP